MKHEFKGNILNDSKETVTDYLFTLTWYICLIQTILYDRNLINNFDDKLYPIGSILLTYQRII